MSSVPQAVAIRRPAVRLPPEVNRILFVKYVVRSAYRSLVKMSFSQFEFGCCFFGFCANRSLPYKISAEDMYDIFGKHGAIRQIRLGNTKATRGTAYVVYEDIFDAKNACENLHGFQVAGRYLTVCAKVFQEIQRCAI